MLSIKLKKRIFLFLTFWVTSLAIFHFNFAYRELQFNDFNNSIETHSDQSEKGISEVGVSQTGDTLGLWFELRPYPDSISWPWIDVKVLFDDFIDVSSYDYIEFEAKDSKPNKIVVSVGLNYPDGTDYPFHSLNQEVLVDSIYSLIKLPVKKFKSGNWWLEKKQIKEMKTEDFNFKQFVCLDIGAGTRSQHYEREYIFIHSMKFTKYTIWPYYLFAGLFALFIIVILFVIITFKLKQKKERKIVLNYATTVEENTPESPSAVGYIIDNYSDVALTLSSVSRSIGLSESKISLEVKTTTGLTFKKYLNKIRIEEAKILLQNRDIKIFTIAEKIGYDNVTNFNRVFKNINGVSPSEFRASLGAK